MKKIISWYQYLSIDVIAGALCSMFFASRIIGIQLHGKYYVLLTIAVYLIYLTDHLYDAFFSVVADNKRNQLYREQLWLFITSGAMLAIAGIILSFQLPQQILKAGYAIGLFSLLYQLGIHFYSTKKWFFKELIIAAIYTFTIWGVPLLAAKPNSIKVLMPVVLPFFMLVLCNVLIFSWYQQQADLDNSRYSLVHFIGAKRLKRLILMLLVVVIVYTLFAVVIYTANIPLLVMMLYQVMSLFMVFIICSPKWLQPDNRYAYVTDSLFILPLFTGLLV